MAAPPKGSSSQRIPVQRGPSSSRMGTVPPARAGSSGRVPTVQRGPSSARMRPATAVRPGSSAMRPAEPMEEGDIPLDEGDGLPPPWWKNRTKLIAVVAVAAILGLIALLALYMAGQQREQEEQQQRRVAAKKAYTEMVEFAKEKPRDYAGRTALAKALEEKAKGYPDFEGAAKQEFAAIEAEQKREVTYKQAAADLNALERDADDPKLAKEVLSKAEALAGRLDPRNTEDQKRLTVILKKSGDFKAWATFNDALEFAKTNASNIDAILSKYDEVMEEAVKNGSAEVHRAAMEEIDRHSQAKYTAEFEGKQPLLDLLEGGAKEQWKVWQENTLDILTEGGSWVLAAKDTGPGVIFTGLDKGWRDFVAEIEFTIEKKGFTFYGRAGRGNEVRYAVEADGPAGLKAGQPYKVKIAIKALHGQAEFADLGVDDFSKKVGLAPLAGGIGLALDTGAKVKFKSIKLRVLRSK
jgi:type II secretory pathway pseudopilin PulG